MGQCRRAAPRDPRMPPTSPLEHDRAPLAPLRGFRRRPCAQGRRLRAPTPRPTISATPTCRQVVCARARRSHPRQLVSPPPSGFVGGFQRVSAPGSGQQPGHIGVAPDSHLEIDPLRHAPHTVGGHADARWLRLGRKPLGRHRARADHVLPELPDIGGRWWCVPRASVPRRFPFSDAHDRLGCPRALSGRSLLRGYWAGDVAGERRRIEGSLGIARMCERS
jgi:hypothetical protein